jgi:hypothetical protein
LEICLKKNMKREADRASVILWKIGKQLGWNPRVYLQNLFCEYELDMPCREAKRISKII